MNEPKIAYREAIKKKIDAEGKHKKQSGGHGQYGHVKIHFAPTEEDGLKFTESVVGGSVPKGYFPAVEKGLTESMQKGVLAGFPMIGLAAVSYTHLAFRIQPLKNPKTEYEVRYAATDMIFPTAK